MGIYSTQVQNENHECIISPYVYPVNCLHDANIECIQGQRAGLYKCSSILDPSFLPYIFGNHFLCAEQNHIFQSYDETAMNNEWPN